MKEKVIKSNIADELGLAIKTRFSFTEVLCINYSEFNIFDRFLLQTNTEITNSAPRKVELIKSNHTVIVGDPFDKLDEIETNFDFIAGNLPLSMRRTKWDNNSIVIHARRNWLMLLKSLLLLNENGLGLYLLEPVLWSKQWTNFEDTLREFGFFVSAIFNAPELFLLPHTSMRPIFILFSRRKVDKVFIAEIEDINTISLQVNNFANQQGTNNLTEGILLSPTEFHDFSTFKAKQQIEKLKTQYKEYVRHKLADISNEINIGRYQKEFEFVDKKNAIYIPKVGHLPIVTGLKSLTRKHQNYIQISLKSDIVLNGYLQLFFASELGQLILQTIQIGATLPRVTKTDLIEVLIPIPSIKEQNLIVTVEKNLVELTKAVETFKQELSLNPRSARTIQEKVFSLLEQLNALSDADKVLSLIRKGESKTLEFKQTLSLDVRKNTKEKYIEKSALKTITGFLNSDGGILLIGISDAGDILGLSDEIARLYKKSNDNFLLHFKNLISKQIGEEFYPNINYNLISVNNKPVLFVKCTPASKPCFLGQKEFYVRTNPATDLLEGPKLYEYIKNRFDD
jgi:hypothetical protein